MVEQHTLDAITLDIEMPEMDGLQTLRELRARGARIPLIMFSTLTERGALATLDGLAAGADDYVAKPANVGNVQENISRIRSEVIPKIKALCCKTRGNRPLVRRNLRKSRNTRPCTPPISNQRIDVVPIGTSTGGPNALAEVSVFLPQVPSPLSSSSTCRLLLLVFSPSALPQFLPSWSEKESRMTRSRPVRYGYSQATIT